MYISQYINIVGEWVVFDSLFSCLFSWLFVLFFISNLKKHLTIHEKMKNRVNINYQCYLRLVLLENALIHFFFQNQSKIIFHEQRAENLKCKLWRILKHYSVFFLGFI